MRYCKKCGEKIADTAKFCPKCGAAQSERKIEQMPLQKPEQIKKSSGNGKMIGIIAAVVVILIVLVFGVKSLFGGSSYEKPIEYLVEGIQKADTKMMMKAVPIDSLLEGAKKKAKELNLDMDQFSKENEAAFYEEMDKGLEEMLAIGEELYGAGLKIDYEIVGKELIRGDDLTELQQTTNFFKWIINRIFKC